MSCVSFLSPAQRAAMRDADGQQMTQEEIQAMHPTPPVTEGKLRRLKVLSESTDPRIRESAALNYHCPDEVLARLAKDPEPGVRGCVARQPNAPTGLLRFLSKDESAQVRTWVAANPSVDEELLAQLAEDEDPTVRKVVAWARAWEREPAPAR